MAKKIVGGMVGVPNPQSDWEQTDPKKADFIKNKPDLHSLKEEIYDVVYTEMDGVREDIEVARDDLEGKINLKADASYAFDDHYIITLSSEECNDVNDILNKISETIDVTYSSRLYRVTINIDYVEYPPINMESILLEGYEADTPYFLLFGHIKPASAFDIYYKYVPDGKWEEMPKGGANIDIDSELSTTSENPVQNKVITAELNNKADSSLAFDGYAETYNEELNDITEYFDFDSYNAEGIYKIYERQRSEDTVSNHYILCVDTSGYEDVRQTLICLSNGKIKQRLYYGEWEVISVSQADLNKYVSKETGKGLSANDFTDELKNKLEAMSEGGADLTVDSELSETSENPVQNKVITAELNNKADSSLAFDGYYDVDGYNTSYNERLYKAKNGFVIQSVASYSESSSYWGVNQYWYTEGKVYYRQLGDEGGWENEWEKISLSQTDLNKAIGDIETSLENIIKKYGLGGDSQ